MTLPRVLGNNVLARRIERGTMKNGIIIPFDLHHLQEYQVCALGSEVKEIVIGDIIAIGYGMHEIVYGEVAYAIVEENQVLAILPTE